MMPTLRIVPQITVDLKRCRSLPVVELGDDFDMCANEMVLLDAGNPGSTYLWSTGATTQTITVDTTGIGLGEVDIWVQVTNPATCVSYDTINILFLDCTGIGEGPERTMLSIQPNPSNGLFDISVQSLMPGTYTVDIFSALGTKVFSTEFNGVNNSFSETLNLMNLHKGIYYLTLSGNNSTIVKKLIINE